MTPTGRLAISSTSPDTAENHAGHIQGGSAGTWGFQMNSQVMDSGVSGGSSSGPNASILPDTQQSLDIDWSSWLPPQNEEMDFNSLHSLSGQMRGQENGYTVSGSTFQDPSSASLAVPSQHLSHRGASPGGHTRREIAKGMAMVTLEAAAEPHYVGESSGSFWSDVITKGMCEPSSANRGRKRLNKRPRDRSPSPTDRHILRTSLQRQLSNEVARHILLTVYQHLHSRVSLIKSNILSSSADYIVPFHGLGHFR